MKQKIQDYFPILKKNINDHPLVYLDSAATMQMPEPVLERINGFYHQENANIHRGIHSLSEKATTEYEQVRRTACRFIGSDDPEEIIFTSGTTASINLAAQMLEPALLEGDEILVTAMEHHSNLLPWMELVKRRNLTLRIVPVRSDGTLDLTAMEQMISEHTRIAAFTEVSNVTGIRNPVASMIELLHKKSPALILIDGAQGVVHGHQCLRDMHPDFYCFSGHKLGAPGGTGVLYIRRTIMEQLKPVSFGGGIVHAVAYDKISYVDGPSLFEPGTPNYPGVIGLGAALEFWMDTEEALDISAEVECTLLENLETALTEIPGLHILGAGQKHYGCLSLVSDQLHAYDICRMLDQYGIAVRSGHMCAQPYLNALGYEHAVRVSIAPYNTKEDIEYLVRSLREILDVVQYRLEITESHALSMKDLEADILNDLSELENPMDQYSFLVACAGECLAFPEQYRTEVNLIKECQVNTWIHTGWLDDTCVFFADSESLIVKGVLALLQELYSGRSQAEIQAYSCTLLDSPLIQKHLNEAQLKGLRAIASSLK